MFCWGSHRGLKAAPTHGWQSLPASEKRHGRDGRTRQTAGLNPTALRISKRSPFWPITDKPLRVGCVVDMGLYPSKAKAWILATCSLRIRLGKASTAILILARKLRGTSLFRHGCRNPASMDGNLGDCDGLKSGNARRLVNHPWPGFRYPCRNDGASSQNENG